MRDAQPQAVRKNDHRDKTGEVDDDLKPFGNVPKRGTTNETGGTGKLVHSSTPLLNLVNSQQ
jgi:hypothetical protein